MVSAEEVICLYKHLSGNGIQIWLTGGWGIDALLGEQTRPHKDLDVIMLLDDVLRMRRLLRRDRYHLKELWSENRQVRDTHNKKTATAFVLQDPEGRELDAHAIRVDDQGNGIPAWKEDEGFLFKRQDLTGTGTIAGRTVRCITPWKQMLCHTGYELPDYQLLDLARLGRRFGIQFPDK